MDANRNFGFKWNSKCVSLFLYVNVFWKMAVVLLFKTAFSPYGKFEKVTAVCLHLCSVSQDDGFCGEDDLFFWWRRQISGEDEGFFYFSLSSPKILHLRQYLHCILMSEAPTLSMCGHTNEGIPSTEHVHMLHWACADIIMRGNPLTDMTDNTEDGNTNWQCLHTRKISPRDGFFKTIFWPEQQSFVFYKSFFDI